jgi:hypothetical protein
VELVIGGGQRSTGGYDGSGCVVQCRPAGDGVHGGEQGHGERSMGRVDRVMSYPVPR